EAERLVKGIGVARLRPAPHAGQRLVGGADHVHCGCCAVRAQAAVWVWKRNIHERATRAPKRSRMRRAHMRRAARNLAASSNRLLWALKKNDSRGANWSRAS